MTLRWLPLAAALAALSACTDFEALARGVCGNGLVETGEDCDSGEATCIRCARACSAATDCASGYACGVDGFCHAPGGALAAPGTPVPFLVDDLRIADLDRDGAGDVLGVSRTSVSVRYGDGTGALAAGESFITPAQSGPPSFGDLDGDGALDLTLETLDGLVSFSSRHGSLAPVAIESPVFGDGGEPLDFTSMFSAGPQQLGAFFTDESIVLLAVIDFLPETPRVFGVAPCAARLGAIPRASFQRSSVDIYRASPPGAAVAQLVVSFVTAAGQPCVTAIHGSPNGLYVLDDITPAGAGALQRAPKLVDLDADGDACPALVNTDSGAQLRRWDGQLQGSHCVLSSGGGSGLALPSTGAPASATVIGRAPLAPPLPGVGADALVMSTGVYVVAPSAITQVYAAARPLAHVAHADLDGDGAVDLVLGPAGEDDLDLLYRHPLGVALLRLDTASRVTSITTGDFDGNGRPDIAYTETALGHQRMMIAYGTSDRPLPPAQVATLGDVASVATLQLPDSVDQLGIADDLVVVQPGAGGGLATLSLLHGSPQRTMLSFFDPRPEGTGAPAVLRAAVVGRFAGGPEPDVLALATDPEVGVRAWTIAGTPRGLDHTPSAGAITAELAACAHGLGAGPCIEDALYLAWPIAPDRDAVLVVDRPAAAVPPAARLIDLGPPPAAALTTRAAPDVVLGVPAGAVPRALHAADLDGDGAPELVAAFSARPSAPAAGSARLCAVSAGVPQRCDELLPLVQVEAPSMTACIDAAPARLSRRGPDAPGTELVVLCRYAGAASGLFGISRGEAGLEAKLLAQGVDLRAIRVADVTGDGVDDVVALKGDGGSQAIVAYRQCTSREAEGCRLAAAPGGAP